MTSTLTATRPSAGARSEMRNGIDVALLRDTIAAIAAEPVKGMTGWSVASMWRGGTRSDHVVNGCEISGKRVDRTFTLSVDEPHELLGGNKFANPQEYLLAGMNSCMMVGYAAGAALMGITLTRLEIEVAGDIDVRGFLGIEPTVKPGYGELQQVVRIAGDATPEQFARLHEIVKATSPNFFNITTSIPANSRLVIEKK